MPETDIVNKLEVALELLELAAAQGTTDSAMLGALRDLTQAFLTRATELTEMVGSIDVANAIALSGIVGLEEFITLLTLAGFFNE